MRLDDSPALEGDRLSSLELAIERTTGHAELGCLVRQKAALDGGQLADVACGSQLTPYRCIVRPDIAAFASELGEEAFSYRTLHTNAEYGRLERAWRASSGHCRHLFESISDDA